MHAGYTLLAPLADLERAHALLKQADANPDRLPFARTTTTHFATVTIIPAQTRGEEALPATLLFATSFSGPIEDHLLELIKHVGPSMRELLACCIGFDRDCSDTDLHDYLLDHRHGDTFYSGMQNLSPGDVVAHQDLRAEIERYLDDNEHILPTDPVALHHAIQNHVRGLPQFAWAQQPFAPPPSAFFALHWRTLIVYAVLLALLGTAAAATIARVFFVHATAVTALAVGSWGTIGALVLAVLGLVLAVHEAEGEQTYVSARQPDEVARALAATQNRPVINEMTIAGPVKEGWLRPLFLRLAFWAVARLAEGLPRLRDPLDIPTVATARWIAADRGRRLIFISNYTNPAEGYVRDFIDTTAGAKNINLSFGFGRGYPPTRWIMGGGALDDANAYMNVVTENQRITAFWYGRYRDISIDNIRIAREIREGLFQAMDKDAAQEWLHKL